MNNKTCGECQWYDYHHLLCVVGGDVAPTDCACDSFIPVKPTNGDRIRHMNTSGLIDVIACPYPNKDCIHRLMKGYACKCCKRDWLNAPAESDGKDE